MAEKTFDELLSGAQTIRDNELPESNTHTLVGEQLVYMVEKSKEESEKKLAISDLASGRGESTITAMTQAAVTQELVAQDEKLTELSSKSQFAVNAGLSPITVDFEEKTLSWEDGGFIIYGNGKNSSSSVLAGEQQFESTNESSGIQYITFNILDNHYHYHKYNDTFDRDNSILVASIAGSSQKVLYSMVDIINTNGDYIYTTPKTLSDKNFSRIDNYLFIDNEIDKYFEELYIEGLESDKEYYVRTFGYNSISDVYQLNLSDNVQNISITQTIFEKGKLYGESLDGNIHIYAVLKNTDEIKGYIIYQNEDSSVAKLKNNVQLLSYSPYISTIFLKAVTEELYEYNTVFFKNTDLNKFFKEFYIEGLDENTEYCLRTLRLNTTTEPHKYQINIGNSTDSILQVFVNVGDVYGEGNNGNIHAKVVLQNTDAITGNLIYANTDTSIATLNKTVCSNLANCPYCASVVNTAGIKTYEDSIKIAPSFNGYSMPKNPQTLKVLHVGNSFADQPISRLQLWLDNMGIQNVTYGIVMRASGTLQQHYNSIINDEPYDANSAFRLYKRINGETTYLDKADPTDKSGETSTNEQIKLSDCLKFTDWDVITFQQGSLLSGKWETIEPYLPTLIKYARYYCPNSGVKIGWQMTWAYAKGYTGLSSYNNSQDEMFEGIVECAKNVCINYGIDLIIPSGVIVQNLRGVPTSFWGEYLTKFRGEEMWTSDTTKADFTDDGLHPNDIAEYCTSAGFVMLIYAACYNKSIRGVDAVLGDINGNYAKVARQCVLKAVGDRFNVSEIDVTKNLE